MRYRWAIPLTTTEDVPRVVISPEEKKDAEAWMAKHGYKLPHENAGDDARISLYQFTTQQTDEINPDDRDGVTFANESFREDVSGQPASLEELDEEKIRAYLGLDSTLDRVAETAGEYQSLESSGPLASSWRLVEKALGSFYRGGSEGITEEQWLRLEQSNNKRPVRKQWRNGRTNLLLRKVWDSVEERLVDQQLTKFYTVRWTTRMAFDATAGEFREIKRLDFNPFDQSAVLDMERRRMDRNSPRRVEILPAPEPIATSELLKHPAGPAREWDGDESVPAYRDWLDSGDYEALQRFRVRIA